jgi:sporulation protein YlmC with PRC-barrel domain
MLLPATALTRDVVNTDGEQLGNVKETMIDAETGAVGYVVLTSGGVLGMGERLVAGPWDALTVDTVEQRFVIAADRDQLLRAAGLDSSAPWPEDAGEEWRHVVRRPGMRSAEPEAGAQPPNLDAQQTREPQPGDITSRP